ncbi:AtpZ/AtpI family protein [Patescibacteria group bacterium]|nr:MAG: AtpZ/AtpI family protein [Patescibacteria group bacterium]
MGKAAATTKTTTAAQGELARLIDSSAKSAARTQLIGSLLGTGWQLAVAVFVPLLLGMWLDRRFDSQPGFTLGLFVVGVALASYVIYREYQSIQHSSRNTSNPTKPKKGRS